MTPGWHLVIHIVTFGSIGWVGFLVWRHWPEPEAADETSTGPDETVAQIDADLALIETDMAVLWPHVVGLTHLVYELLGQPIPAGSPADVHRASRDDGEPTEEHAAVVDDEPEPVDTVVSHPADLGARMLALLHRAETTAGRHRAENGGPSVDQVSDGIDTRLLPHVARDWNKAASASGEATAGGPKSQGER